MKLKFKTQEYQTHAVNCVVDLFRGQERNNTTFGMQNEVNTLFNEYGIGNNLMLDNKTIEKNMNIVQKRTRVDYTSILEDDKLNFCIEMETGTGKTYVYTKTIFELNKNYGFTKFIIVVPSVAIREGVYKSFQVTEDHFKILYNNVPYKYFIYNSSKLANVKQFATSNNIEIMIINIDAFKKSENIINQDNDKLMGDKAIDYIRNTNPIVIIDEPQSVDNTEKSKDAIESLNPLAVLRYSATHKESINTLYKLTPIDAYQNGLVKQISVYSHSIENDFNKAYIKLLEVSQKDGFKAKVELDIANKKGEVSRKTKVIKQGDDLELITNREIYKNYVVTQIDCTENFESVEFQNTEKVKLSLSIGSVDELYIKEKQIRDTIRIHLNKELILRKKGIKVLSLFFIDKVEKYRTIASEKGVYAEIFEKCYNELINLEKYSELRQNFDNNVDKIHNGYFSQDKKGTFKDTKGNTLADDDTYNTIMRDKEYLLSFKSPLRFIFSHSALKEGWDNPNVFQVCTLIEQKSIFTCRQKIGRGLRLCVNQNGDRIEDKNINNLHVICNESFESFAKNLQKEIEVDTGFKFGILQLSLFTGLTYEEIKIIERPLENSEAKKVLEILKSNDYFKIDTSLESKPVQQVIENITKSMENKDISQELDKINIEVISKFKYSEEVKETREITQSDALELIEHFKEKDYIKPDGTINDTLKQALKNNKIELPPKYENARDLVENIILKSSSGANQYIKNAKEEVTIKLKEDILISEKFLELWDKIKYKTYYQVNFDIDRLINVCVEELKNMEHIGKPKFVTKIADVKMRNTNILLEEKNTNISNLDTSSDKFNIPDIIKIISEKAMMQQKEVFEILKRSEKLHMYLINPQIFIERTAEIITRTRHKMAIQGIKYYKSNNDEYYIQEIFGDNEIIGTLNSNAIPVKNSIYDYIKYDSSTIEKPFARDLDNDDNVEMFFKIPSAFKIETPIGNYNPDWAIYFRNDNEEKLYFVVETKGTTNDLHLRESESLKIYCGKEHFKAIDNNDNLKLEVSNNWSKLKINEI